MLINETIYMATWQFFLSDRYVSQYLPNQCFGPWTWVQPILNGSQSWSLQSYAVFWKAVSDFMLSSDYVWLSVAGVRTLTDRRETGEEGYVVRRSWQACGTFPLRRGMKRYHAVLCFSHRSITSLQTTESCYRDTDQTGYKLPMFHLAEKIWW